MEVLWVGVKSELKLPAYTTATATQDPSHVCNVHHSSWKCQILNPMSKAREWTHILWDTSQVHYHWATMGTHNRYNIYMKPQKIPKSQSNLEKEKQSRWITIPNFNTPLFFFFNLFMAALSACGSSQAKGQIRATATSQCHSHTNSGSEPCLWPIPQLTALSILNPLRESRNWTHVFMDNSQVYYYWATWELP